MKPDIKLTKENYLHELRTFNLPNVVVDMLSSLVGRFINDSEMPAMKDYHELKMTMENTNGELWIDDKRFEIVVWHPIGVARDAAIWCLLPTYGYGEYVDYFKHNRSSDKERFKC